MEGELVHRKVPKLCTVRRAVCALLRVLISSIIAQPDIVSPFYKLEGQAPVFFRDAYPDFTVHEETMMEIYDLLGDAPGTRVYAGAFLTLPKRKPMESQKIAIFGLNNMFLGLIPIECA